ncbi:Ltp family lipoprotein [Cellulomonas denverensis]|uniref:Ltp family lipoprotein n=1 Tax=Cellulomonas denverensis TaxID=264297 RepID=UPI001B34AC9B|nr:Ltp family lipoprotein [Cellulomonas denverensis]
MLVTVGVLILIGAIGAVAGNSDSGDDPQAASTASGLAVRDDAIEVPDVVGMSLDDAVAALTKAGLTYNTIGDSGEVETQAPSGGTDVLPGTQVLLTVVDREAEKAAEEARQAEEQAAEEARQAEEQAAADAAAAAEAARIGNVSQQNAYRSAVSYLDFSAFSRAGLIRQLTSEYGEGYPPEDAEFAVARLEAEGGVDWNAEAAEAAASYLEYSAFSRQGLLDQLTSEYGEQFTPEQAEYGVSTTGL